MRIKKPLEIEAIAEGGKLLNRVLAQVIERVRAGATGRELAAYAEQLIIAAGGRPAFKGYGKPPFPAALCVSVNSCVVHGIPTDEPFKSGDIIGLDIGMVYKGLYTDMARTVAIDPISSREQELISVTRKALDLALKIVKPGIHTGDIGAVIQDYVEERGFGVVRDLAGHGVGYALHEDPDVPNFGDPGTGTLLKPGLVVAIEPMITMGNWEVYAGTDRWSIMTVDQSKTAHFEDMVAVTETGGRILTR